MSIDEFNENYRISVITEASVDAELSNKFDDELEYGSLEAMHDNKNYTVYDKATQNAVIDIDVDNDAAFIDEIRNVLNVDI